MRYNRFMKRLGFLILSCTALQAAERDWTMEFRAGAFIPLAHKIQQIFGHGWIEGEAEFSYQFYPHWRVFGNVNYSCKARNQRHHHRHIQLLPFSAGVKYHFLLGSIQPYLGIGPCYTFLHTSHYSHRLTHKNYKNQFGFVGKSGVFFELPRHLFLDLFCDYTYQKMTFDTSHIKINASGFRTGIGFGFTF